MSTISTSARPTPEKIFNSLNAYQQTSALKTAIELGLFTAIDEGKQTAPEIAKQVGASERGVRILCDYLTIQGYLSKEGGAYTLAADAAMFLSQKSRAYLGSIVGFLANDYHFKDFAGLTEAVRRGGRATGDGSNKQPDEIWVSFARSMAPLTIPPAMFIAQLVGAQAGQPCKVLDIAAGHGMYGITIAQQNPKASVTAVDWPAVLEVAKEHAEKAGVAERYAVRPGSAFETDFGEGYDLALLTNIFHHFDEANCVELMKRVHKALKPSGRAVTLEFVPNEDRVTPPTAAAFSLIMLAHTDAGDAYTAAEYSKMFGSAGFGKTTAHAVPGIPQTVLVSEKG